jgi:hypothetical protein
VINRVLFADHLLIFVQLRPALGTLEALRVERDAEPSHVHYRLVPVRFLANYAFRRVFLVTSQANHESRPFRELPFFVKPFSTYDHFAFLTFETFLMILGAKGHQILVFDGFTALKTLRKQFEVAWPADSLSLRVYEVAALYL